MQKIFEAGLMGEERPISFIANVSVLSLCIQIIFQEIFRSKADGRDTISFIASVSELSPTSDFSRQA